jgi:hypothetical protein
MDEKGQSGGGLTAGKKKFLIADGRQQNQLKSREPGADV